MTATFEDVDPLRRRIMSAVCGRDTQPEMTVRWLLHSMNYRYRLHRKDLPGGPDVVIAERRKAIFVQGCETRCPTDLSGELRQFLNDDDSAGSQTQEAR